MSIQAINLFRIRQLKNPERFVPLWTFLLFFILVTDASSNHETRISTLEQGGSGGSNILSFTGTTNSNAMYTISKDIHDNLISVISTSRYTTSEPIFFFTITLQDGSHTSYYIKSYTLQQDGSFSTTDRIIIPASNVSFICHYLS